MCCFPVSGGLIYAKSIWFSSTSRECRNMGGKPLRCSADTEAKRSCSAPSFWGFFNRLNAYVVGFKYLLGSLQKVGVPVYISLIVVNAAFLAVSPSCLLLLMMVLKINKFFS